MRQTQLPFAGDVGDVPEVSREGHVMKMGGALAVLGGLGYLAGPLWHGDMPDQTTEITPRPIAAGRSGGWST